MIAPTDLTIPLLTDIGRQAYELYAACHSALGLDAEAAERVCIAGRRISQLLGLSAAPAPDAELVDDFETDKAETIDMDPEDL